MKLEECRSVADRMRWVLEHRKQFVKNARQWGVRAGLKPPTVSAIMKRDSGMNSETARRLAEVARVSLDWLVAGMGAPEGSLVARAFPGGKDPLARRRIATARAKKLGVPEAIIHRVVYGARFNTPAHAHWKSSQWVAVLLEEWSAELVARAARSTSSSRAPQNTDHGAD